MNITFMGIGTDWKSSLIKDLAKISEGRPNAADKERGPHPVCIRNATICASASGKRVAMKRPRMISSSCSNDPRRPG
jgi:hypothetical protein